MLENFTVVIYFLYWAEQQDPKMMYGSHTVAEAFDAIAAIMGVPADKLRERCGSTMVCNA